MRETIHTARAITIRAIVIVSIMSCVGSFMRHSLPLMAQAIGVSISVFLVVAALVSFLRALFGG